MLLIFISWLYILFTVVNFGFITHKLLKINKKYFIVIAFSGLFSVTLLAGFWAILWRINVEFHLVLLILNLLFFLKFKSGIQKVCISFFYKIKKLPFFLKSLLGIITVLILAQCASVPYIIDNESYYIQTIKSLNEFGLVKGLANLHLFLGQMSGWHITQSVFNFSFLFKNFNDLSGFCLWLGNVFSIIKLNEYFQNRKIHYLLIGMFPLANLFFFQFISTPSPDIPVFIFSLIIFYYFLESFPRFDVEIFRVISLLVLFALLIKPTTLILVFVPVFMVVWNLKNALPRISSILVTSIVVLLFFIIKNSIISGYPFYPFTFLSIETDFTLPKILAEFYYELTRLSAFHLTAVQLEEMSFYQLFMHWLNLPKLDGLFNKSILLLILITPFLLYKFYHKKAFWILYILMCFQFVLLVNSSPQYRFFMNFTLLFTFFIIALIFKEKRHLYSLLALSVFVTVFFLFVPVKLNVFTNNTLANENSTFSYRNIVLPHPNSKFDLNFEKYQEGNLEYYSLQNSPFFWVAGDCPIPCVNKEQIAYFKTYFKVVPQQRTVRLKDGFISKRIENE